MRLTLKRSALSILLALLATNSLAAEQEDPIEVKKSESLVTKAEKVRGDLNSFMQDAAGWIDNLSTYDESDTAASAKGYLQLSWLPRSQDLSEIDATFKVKLFLPKWEDQISLVLDNDDEDDIKLDYEADSLFKEDESQELNIAVQSLKELNEHIKIKNRVGISRSQLYLRSELKMKWSFDSFEFSFRPRIDYFRKDGWAPGAKASFSYPMDKNALSVSISWQKIEKEEAARQKAGFYYISNIKTDHMLVSGLQYKVDQYSNDSYLASMRYRQKLYKDWVSWEVEPFVEFREELDYHREVGIGLRLIASYGN